MVCFLVSFLSHPGNLMTVFLLKIFFFFYWSMKSKVWELRLLSGFQDVGIFLLTPAIGEGSQIPMFDFVMNISCLKNMFTFLFCLLVTELCQRRLQPPLNPIAKSQHQEITNTAVNSTKQKKGSARQAPLLSERCCPTERFLSRSHSVETGPIDDIGSGPKKCH